MWDGGGEEGRLGLRRGGISSSSAHRYPVPLSGLDPTGLVAGV